jgi:hypothetical protein
VGDAVAAEYSMYEEIIKSIRSAPNAELRGGVRQDFIDLYSVTLPWEFDHYTNQWFLECGQGGGTGMGGVLGMIPGRGEVWMSPYVSNALQIADDGCGNYYAVREVRGRHCVFFVDSIADDDFDQCPPTMYATSVYHFWLIYSKVVHRSKSRNLWYSSKRALLSLDPDLEKYTDFIRPWEED